MTETFPQIPAHVRVISVVVHRLGYQAMIEEEVPIAFHPYKATIVRVARSQTICKAIEAALTGRRLQNRSVS